MPVIRKVLKEESNLLNAVMLVVFAVPGIVAAWVLTAFGHGWSGTGLTLLAVAASCAYSFGFLTLVEDRR